jgi:thiamine biosynthesis lipoprotein ApbE
VNPAPEFVELLQTSLRYAELTGGMFDPTVQPLWELYANLLRKWILIPQDPTSHPSKRRSHA